MKILLVTINIVLAFIALGVIHNTVAGSKKQQTVVTAVTPASGSKSKKSFSGRKQVRRQQQKKELPSMAEAEKQIVALDIFNKVRSPLANERTSRSQLTLVGTFTMGNVKGAIIRQQNAARQFNPYLAQAMMAGNMGNRGGNMGNRGGNMGNRGGNMGNRGGNMGNRGGNMGNRGGMRGGFSSWSQVSSGRNNTVKQYVRVGDTLSNGYTLVEVSRSHAVLLRGNDKIELELQDPSRNRASNRRTPQRMNATQQFQQAQMIMQRQMMNTMRQMQNTIQNQQRSNNNSRGGARRR